MRISMIVCVLHLVLFLGCTVTIIWDAVVSHRRLRLILTQLSSRRIDVITIRKTEASLRDGRITE